MYIYEFDWKTKRERERENVNNCRSERDGKEKINFYFIIWHAIR